MAGPASPAFVQGSSWSPSQGDSCVPEPPVASWWHALGRAAHRHGWAMQPGLQDGYARACPQSRCFKPAFWDVPKACFNLPLCFIWRLPGELVWMCFCQPAQQNQTGGYCSSGCIKVTQHSPFGGAVAINGVGALLRGGEEAPACGVGGMGEAGRCEHALGGRLGQTSTLRPHPSFLQTFFFNIFESPAELFDAPIFITVSFRKCWSCPSGGLGRCLGPSPCPPPHSALGSVPPFPRQACSRVLHPGRIWAVFTVFPYFHPTGCGLSVFPDRLCDRGVSSKSTLSPLPPCFLPR